MQERFFFRGERVRCVALAQRSERCAGRQPLRVLLQQLGKGEEVLQFDVFAETQFPLVHGRRRDVQGLSHVRL